MEPQQDTDGPARITWRPGPLTYLAGAVAVTALVLAAVLVGAVVEGRVDDPEVFCASASALERAVQRQEIAEPEAFPGEERDHALEELDEALARFRQAAPPSLRADVDRYANGFPLMGGSLGIAPRESGERIAEVVEAECGFAFDHLPGPARRG